MKPLIIILTVHIWAVHTKLLYYLNPEMVEKIPFSYLTFNEPTVLAMIFALSYSLATAFVIYKTDTKRIIITYAVLDGLSVLLYYFTKLPIWISAFYFSIYTFILIASVISVRIPDTMESLSKKGFKLADIAKKFNVSESTVSRRLRK